MADGKRSSTIASTYITINDKTAAEWLFFAAVLLYC